MELISTVKMKKAQDNVLSLRPFALAVLQILAKVTQNEDVFGVFSKVPESPRELVIMVAAQK